MLRQDAMPGVTKPGVPARSRTIVPWLVGLVIVLAVALGAFAATYAAPLLTTTPGEALADDMIAAWNAHDPVATRAFYTDDAFAWSSANSEPEARGIDEIASMAQYGGLTIERTGPVTESAGLAWWPIHVSSAYDVHGDDAVAVMVLRDGKIAQHWVIWRGDTP